MYRLSYPDGSKSPLLPDPHSRFQPEDVHGPSQVMDNEAYQWQSAYKPLPDKRRLNVQKIHIGTFTRQGTFESALKKLDELRKNGKGYNAVDIMPIKEFPGKRNWGYDMVDFFAVENSYGKPDDFKRFVDECHKRGIAVLLDVVYNHVGPEGNYFKFFDQGFMSNTPTPWGEGFNWENPQAVNFVKDNLSMWLKEFNVDGFRFDMTNHIPDQGSRQITSYLAQHHPQAILIAEDGRSDNYVTLPVVKGGLGFWAKWNFVYHHYVKSASTGQSHMNAPTDFGSMANMLVHGFEPDKPQMNSLCDAVNFYESHDEIGNHDGRRTNVKLADWDPAEGTRKFKLFSILKFLSPGIPMTFMGEQYGEQNPFYFFANYGDKAVINGMREGRKSSPQPDALKYSTFKASKLSWKKDTGLDNLNRDMAVLRENTPALWQGDRKEMGIHTQYLMSNVLMIHRWGKENPENQVLMVANMSGMNYQGNYHINLPGSGWKEVLNSDALRYGGNGTYNPGIYSGNPGLSLAPWSVAIFKRNHG